jgi:hypothetical protein
MSDFKMKQNINRKAEHLGNNYRNIQIEQETDRDCLRERTDGGNHRGRDREGWKSQKVRNKEKKEHSERERERQREKGRKGRKGRGGDFNSDR